MKLLKFGIRFTAGIYRDKLSTDVGIFIGLMSYSEVPIAAMLCYALLLLLFPLISKLISVL